MPSFMHLGLANAACAAILASLAFVIGRRLRRPAVKHCLWLLVLVKLVTPPGFALPLAWLPPGTELDGRAAEEPKTELVVYEATWEAQPVGPPTAADVWAEMEKTRSIDALSKDQQLAIVRPEGRVTGDADVANQVVAPASSSTAPPLHTAAPTPPPPADVLSSTFTMLGTVWLIGSAVWFVRSGRRLARFQRLLRHARPVPDEVRLLGERISRQFGLRRCPDIALLPSLLPPMVWAALGRVRILLPARLLERLDDNQLAAVLAHELAHVRRGDHWVRRLEFVALGLFWWYPVAWWARARLQQEEEDCCDAWVVEALPAHAYASAIVETVDFLAEDLAAVPALASGLGRTDSLKRRLTLILRGTEPKGLTFFGRLAVLALALALLPFLPTLARSEKILKPPVPSKPAASALQADRASEEALSLRPSPLNLSGGDNEIASLAVSRDGRHLAAGSGYSNRPGEVRVWTVLGHQEVLTFATAQGVTSVAFSPDGRHLASAGYDRQAVIREFPSGKITLVLPLDGTGYLDFSVDGSILVTATQAQTVKLWDAKNGTEIARLEGELSPWNGVGFSPDGRLIAAAGGTFNSAYGNASNHVTLWDARTHKQIGTLKGHIHPVLGVAFSPNSKMIASACADGTVRLWQTDGFKELGALTGHDNAAKDVTFTPDGKTLATASHDGTIRLWDVASKSPLTRLDGHIMPAQAVAVSPDGRFLFSGGAQRVLKVWDLATRRELASFQPAAGRPEEDSVILAMAYTPDGKLVATAQENGVVCLRNAANGDLVRILEGHEDAVTCLVFARDGKSLITGSSDRSIREWDLETGKQVRALPGQANWVYALALSPDGKTLASAGYDKMVRLWNLEDLREKGTLRGHLGAIRALSFSPDGKTLASGAGDQSIKLWDLDKLEEKVTMRGHEGTVRAVAFAPNGQTLVSGSEDGSIRLWTNAGAVRAVSRGHGGKVTAVAFSPGGRYVVTTSMDMTCRLWDATTGQLLQTLGGLGDAATCLAWSPDGRFLVTAGYDRSVKLWIVTTGPLRVLRGHTGPVQAVSFSPDGRFVLSSSGWPAGDKTLRLWEAQSGKQVRKFEGHADQVACAAFSPDGKRILSGSFDKTARLWDVDTGQLIRTFEGHQKPIARLAFSPDGNLAATASHDKTLRIWDLESGACRHVLQGHGDFVLGVVFTADGKRVFSSSRDGTVRVWDAATGEQVNLFELKRGPVNCLAVSPDGKRLAVGHGTAVRLLDVESGRPVSQLDGHSQDVLALAFAPDGKTLLTGSMDTTARLWDLATGREFHLYRGHQNWVRAVNFAPDGRRIVTAGGGFKDGDAEGPGNDFAIRIWPLPDTSATAGRVFKLSIKTEK